MTEAARQPVYVFEGFHLDAQRRVLFSPDGHSISLTPRLFDSLLYFVERAGQLLTKEQLMEALWPRVVVEEHNLNKIVSELRRVLGERPGEHRFIVTKPAQGYRFVATVSVDPGIGASSASERLVSEPTVGPGLKSVSARRRWKLVGSSAGALAIVLAAGFFRPVPNPMLRTTPWASEKGGQSMPVWSPDGTEVVWATRALNIRALHEPVPRTIAPLPGGPPVITQWVSDGKIFFFGRDGLYSISPAGAPPVLDVPMDYGELGISAGFRTVHLTRDGTTLAMLATAEDGVAIWTATPRNATRQRYEPAPFAAMGYNNAPFLRFSPDGKQLLLVWYAAGRGEEAWLLPFPADANNPPRRVLEDLPLGDGSAEFSWFPDNRHIVISTGRERTGTLYVADTQSGKFRVLANELTDQKSVPVVSPDGSKLIFGDLKLDFDIVTFDFQKREVRNTIETDRMEGQPSWAATANALVYVTDRSGAWEIWLRQPPQADRPLVTQRDFGDSTTQYLVAPMLNPGGERLIFFRVEAERPGARLWMSAVDGGRPELLTNDDGIEELAGSWSPDGLWYAYLARTPGGPRMLKKVKTTGGATPETLREGLAGDGSPAPIWSADGNWILVPNEGMTLVSADGKTSRDLEIEDSACTFADDNSLLCVRDTRSSPERPFVRLDLNGNLIDTLATLPRGLQPSFWFNPGLRLSLTPDRSGVTYAVNRSAQNLFLMEGLDTVELP